MHVDAMLGQDLARAGSGARALEDQGYGVAWCGETAHDAFVQLTLAAVATERIRLGTGVAIAFARNPMSLAVLANDLQTVTRGRFLLGLGSQIRPHIERRYSMTWSHPAARMRETVLAIRHIWNAWEQGTPLAFDGDFFTHTLMTPNFDPGPNAYGNPEVFVAAVGTIMTRVAGEVGDGLLLHSFVTERYLRSVTLPAYENGIALGGRSRDDVSISYPAFVVTGRTEDELARAADGVRTQIAFYGSTPSYRPVLELHGWGDLHAELHALSKQGAWTTMTQLVDDEVLRAFAVVGTPREAARELFERVGDVVDRVTPYLPYDSDEDCVLELADALRSAGAPSPATVPAAVRPTTRSGT
jgi:probable F420-dependent oxidoreductase